MSVGDVQHEADITPLLPRVGLLQGTELRLSDEPVQRIVSYLHEHKQLPPKPGYSYKVGCLSHRLTLSDRPMAPPDTS